MEKVKQIKPRYTVEQTTLNLDTALLKGKEAVFNQIAAMVLVHESHKPVDAQTLCREAIIASHGGKVNNSRPNAGLQLYDHHSQWIRVARELHKVKELQELIADAIQIEAAQEIVFNYVCDYGTFSALRDATVKAKDKAGHDKQGKPRRDKPAGEAMHKALKAITELLLAEPEEGTTYSLDAFFTALESDKELQERRVVHAKWMRQHIAAKAAVHALEEKKAA